MMIEKRDDFNKEIERISQFVLAKGECDVNSEDFKESFFRQSSHSPDNTESIELIEYGSVRKEYQPNVETFGIKIKGKNILLSDIICLMENEEISNLIAKEFPELTVREIEAAQRVMTVVMLGFQCRKMESDRE